MTCQACQTWNGNEEHRCRRCGRRLRATPTRHVREGYPIAATALAYQPPDLGEDIGEIGADARSAPPESAAQQPLFAAPNGRRVIPFDQLTSPAERESIRARAAQLRQPNPVRSAKVEVSARPRRSQSNTASQQQFDFSEETEIAAAPQSAIPCGAPVAPPMLRLGAALVDGFMVLFAAFLFLVTFRLATGTLPSGKLVFSAYFACYIALALTYKLIWCVADRDTFGMKAARLRLVDLDGNPPSQKRRFWRAFSGFLSVGAAGLGLIWTFADADGLAWHDQISATFPTFAEE
jgi:uncharacterized RDD family membrane protein YckC